VRLRNGGRADRPPGDRRTSSLLILRLSALGDVIHTLPAVLALKEALPEAEFSWVVESPYREIVEIAGGIGTIPVRMKRWGRAPLASRAEIRGAFRAMRGGGASVDFQGLTKSALLGWLSGADVRFGFDSHAIREKPALLFTNRKVAVDTSAHVIEQNLQLAAAVAASHDVRLPEEAPRDGWSRFPADPEQRLSACANAIVLLPGAGKASKIWSSANFAALARALGPRALAVWGPGERPLAEATGARVAPPTSLRELAWILQRAELVIGGDTGPLHLAVALGTRVIGLYGPTDPRRNGPYGQLHHCVSRFETTKLMESISVDHVMTLVTRTVPQ
jgi:heptosyltransferase I